MLENIAAIIGAISGVVSIAMLVYLFGFKMGAINSCLNDYKECKKTYPPAEIYTMVKTLWQVYILDALHRRPDLAHEGSPYKLSKAGEQLIPEKIKALVDKINFNPRKIEDLVTGYLIVENIGVELLNQTADEMKLSVQETVAILSTYLEYHSNSARLGK